MAGGGDAARPPRDECEHCASERRDGREVEGGDLRGSQHTAWSPQKGPEPQRWNFPLRRKPGAGPRV